MISRDGLRGGEQNPTADQRAALLKLRDLNGYVSAPYHLYSDEMKSPKAVTGWGSLFFPPKN